MYQNPLHIIPSDKRDNLTSNTLKRIKKELLLRFDLTNETTVEINGKTYDKNTVIETFDQLKGDVSYHIQVLKHPKLLAFLEEGKMDFFQSRGELPVLHDSNFREWVRPYFVENLSRVYYQAVTHKGFRSVNQLREMQQSHFRIPEDWADAVFAKSFKFLNNYISEAENRFIIPTIENNDRKLRPELAEYVEVFYMNIYKYLPKERFANLKYRYGIFCNQIVYKMFKDKPTLIKFDVPTLKILKSAATIAAEVFNQEGNRQIARSITHHLTNERDLHKDELSPGRILLYVVLFIIFLFRLATCASRTSNNNYNNYEYVYNNKKAASENLIFKSITREGELKKEAQNPVIDFDDNPKLVDTNGDKYFYTLNARTDLFPSLAYLKIRLDKIDVADELKGEVYLKLVMEDKHRLKRELLYKKIAETKNRYNYRYTLEKSSPKVTSLELASSYEKPYNIEGDIYVRGLKATGFSAYIRPQKNELKYKIAGYGNAIDTLQLSTLLASDFINGPSIEGNGTTRLQHVKSALANLFAVKGLHLDAIKKTNSVDIYRGKMVGHKMEKGFVEWSTSPYQNLHLLKVNTSSYTVYYYVDKKTNMVQEMQFIGDNVKMLVYCSPK